MSRPLPLKPLATAAFLLVGAACAGGPQPDSPFDRGLDFIDVEVRNLNWSDATLWAHGSGTRRRLGTVSGKGTDTFRVEWTHSQPLAIEIDLLAGGRCMTPELMTDPGDIIELEIPIEFRAGPCR